MILLNDIWIHEIFTKLSVRSLISLSKTCKHLHDLIIERYGLFLNNWQNNYRFICIYGRSRLIAMAAAETGILHLVVKYTRKLCSYGICSVFESAVKGGHKSVMDQLMNEYSNYYYTCENGEWNFYRNYHL